MKKKILFIFIIFVMLIAIGIIYLNKVFFPIQLKSIVATKAKELLKRDISFEAISFSPLKGVVVSNLKIKETDDSTNSFIEIKEIAASILYAPLFKEKKIIIPSLTITDPIVRVTKISSKKWNFSDLLKLASAPESSSTENSFSFALTGLHIKNGEIQFLDKSLQPFYAENIEDLNLNLSLNLPQGIKFDLTATLPKNSSAMIINGQSDLKADDLSAQVDLTNINLGEYASLYLTQVPVQLSNALLKNGLTKITKKGKKIKITNQLEITDALLSLQENQKIQSNIKTSALTIKFDLPGENIEASGDLELSSLAASLGQDMNIKADIVSPYLSVSLLSAGTTKLQGNFNINNAQILLPEKRNLNGNIQLTNAQVQIKPEEITGQGKIQIDNLSTSLSPTQNLVGQLSANIKQFKTTPNGYVTISSDEFLLSKIKFNLNQSQTLSGDIKSTDVNLDIQPEKIRLVLGKFDVDQAIAQISPDQRFQGNIQSTSTTFDLEQQTIALKTNLQLKEALIRLAPTIEINGDSLASLNLTMDLQKPETLSFWGTLSPNMLAVRGIPTLQEIQNLKGEIDFKTNELNIKNLSFLTQEIPLSLTGRVENLTDPTLDVVVLSDEINLEKIMPLIPAETLSNLKINPTGTLKDIQLTFKGKPTKIEQASIELKTQLQNVNLSGEPLPEPVQNISGNITYLTNQLKWENLVGLYGVYDFETTGELTDLKSPKVALAVASKYLSLNAQSKIKVENKTIIIDSLNGNLKNSLINLSGKVNLADQEPPSFNILGTIKTSTDDLALLSPDLKKQLETLKIKTPVNWQGNLSGRIDNFKQWKMDFILQTPELIIQDYHIQDLKLTMKDANATNKSYELSASLYEGKLNAQGEIDLAKPTFTYTLNATLDKTNLEQLKNDTIWKKENVSGFVSANLNAFGPLTDWQKISGTSRLLLSEGNIWQVNLFKGLGKILFPTEFETIQINEISGDFNLDNGKATTQNLLIKTQPAIISAQGWMGFDGQLDFNISSEFSPEILSGSDTFRQSLTSLIASSGTLINVRFFGTMKEPKHTVLPSPKKIIEKGINLLLEGVKDVL